MLTLLEKFIQKIEEYNLIEENDRILVAVSGGVDSSVLLNLLAKIREYFKFSIFCATVDHGIRKESKEEVKFVYNMARSLNVECFIKEFDVPLYAKENKLSIEEAARKLRYKFLNEIAKKINANKVATAHNLNDLAETVLFRLARGTGPFGIYGMKPRNGNIIRPLLFFERKEIEQFATENKIPFVVDKTNFDTKYTRNFIRHKIIPIFKEINPLFEQAVLRFVENVWELDCFVEEKLNVKTFEFEGRIFFKVPKDEYILVEFIRRKTMEHFGRAPDKEKLDRLKKNLYKTSFKISFWGDYGVEISYGYGVLGKFIEHMNYECSMDCQNNVNFGPFVVKFGNNGIIFKKMNLTIRNYRFGDKTKGGKKLKEIFVEKKVPSFIRRIIPIFVDEDGYVFYIPNVFLDRDYLSKEENGISIKVEMKGGFWF